MVAVWVAAVSVVAVGLQWGLRHTMAGKAVRAVAQDRRREEGPGGRGFGEQSREHLHATALLDGKARDVDVRPRP